ncbi:hypothetical protein FACS1894202_13890 [Clostridia bacterium]|nr:hypothetical protein FACS1894202_13890 [Clostridia bacterium]
MRYKSVTQNKVITLRVDEKSYEALQLLAVNGSKHVSDVCREFIAEGLENKRVVGGLNADVVRKIVREELERAKR